MKISWRRAIAPVLAAPFDTFTLTELAEPDRRTLLAEMREIKRIAQGLLDEIRAMRERHGDRSEIADKILKPKQGAEY